MVRAVPDEIHVEVNNTARLKTLRALVIITAAFTDVFAVKESYACGGNLNFPARIGYDTETRDTWRHGNHSGKKNVVSVADAASMALLAASLNIGYIRVRLISCSNKRNACY